MHPSSCIPTRLLVGGLLAALATAGTACAQPSAQQKGGPAPDPGLRLAPAPRAIDGLTATPIDIHDLLGTLLLDVEKKEATATARMSFSMSQKGHPVFDLRQDDIRSARLNGEQIDASTFAMRDFGQATGTMRVLDRELEPGMVHVLELEYGVSKPASPQAMEIGWREGGVYYDTWFSDLNQGRYMEQWYPANLLYDSFGMVWEIQVTGAAKEHHMVTNGTVEVLGEHHWKLIFPDTFTAFSHMVVIIPKDEVEHTTASFALEGVGEIEVVVCRRLEARVDNATVHAQIESDIKEFHESMGEYRHGTRFDAYIWTGGRSMEYDGATTSSMGALRHEIFHSWFGRGAKPGSQNAGWWDEAWTVWFSDGGRPRRVNDSAVTLSPSDPWSRVTPGASYRAGSAMFSRLAATMTAEKLIELMAEFYQQHALGVASTKELEEHLAQGSGMEAEVRAIFHRYVYGNEEEFVERD